MAIEIIPNQPVLFRPVGWREPCPCDNCEPDCMLVQHSDYIYAQIKMTPCGDDFICGQPILGDELVSNGTFSGNADGWTLNPGWTYTADEICNDGSAGSAIQSIAITAGNTYVITFEIIEYTSGTLSVFLGGTMFATSYTSTGVFTIIMAAGGINTDIRLDSNPDFIGCISNVSVRGYPDCWNTSFPGDDPFTYTDESVCISGTGNLFTDTLANTPGYYIASFTISNYTSGTLQVSGACTDTWVGGPFSANGEKFAYGTFAAPGVLCFEFTDFFGCISDIQLHRLYIPQFVIENTSTGQQYLDFGGFLSLVEDRIILKFRPLEFLPYDCYKICLIDTCLLAGTTNKVTNGTFDSDLTGWSPGSGWSWDITNGGEAVFDRNAGTGSLSQQFSVTDINVCCRITVYSIVGSGAFVRLTLRNAANNVVTDLDITTAGVYTICGFGNQIAVEPSNSAGAGMEVDNIGVFQITDCEDCSSYDYCSNCIKFAADFESCVLLLESYENANGAWGFVWNNSAGTNVFKLSHRIASKLWHPAYPEDSNDYTFSEGKTQDTFAQSDKVWTLGIDPTFEREHDVLRLQKRSKNFFITDVNGTQEYFAEKGDYNPDWPTGGCKAPADIKVKLKTSTLFNNLCT